MATGDSFKGIVLAGKAIMLEQ